MDLGIRGHVALIQGAGRGIGRGIAESLAREGCDVVITARTMASLEETARNIQNMHGVSVVKVAADSGDHRENAKTLGAVIESFGRLDIVVANGGGPPSGTFATLDHEQWRIAAESLVIAPAMLLKEAMLHLRNSRAPRFFIVTSSSTRVPVKGLTLSNTFRPALVGMIKTAAQEFARDGLRCHSIAPGRINTGRLSHVLDAQAKMAGKTVEEMTSAMLASIPVGRIGEPKDLGSLVAFLCSPLADYLTGQNYLVDGGFVEAL